MIIEHQPEPGACREWKRAEHHPSEGDRGLSTHSILASSESADSTEALPATLHLLELTVRPGIGKGTGLPHHQ